MRKVVVLLFLVLCGYAVWCQDSGTKAASDTTIRTPVIKKHALQRPRVLHRDSAAALDSLTARDSIVRTASILSNLPEKDFRPAIKLFRREPAGTFLWWSPFFRFTDPMQYSITVKKWQGKEALFYSIIALLIYFALIRNGFGRYLSDLFKTYFRTAVNQKQAKEQLLQNPLPSVLLNLFFVLSIGMFLALMFQYFKLGLDYNFWLLYLYCLSGLVCIYAAKFVSLKLIGWILQVQDSTDAYIFIVFTTNKIIGIALLPFLILLAFTYGVVSQAAMSLSIMVVVAMIVYRFFLSYISIRRQVKVGFFHFLLYLIAFELIPLLLINKLLFSFLGETY